MTLMECLTLIGPWERLVVWITAAIGIVFFIVAMWRIDKGSSEFRLVDLVLEGDPPKASVNKLTLIVFAGLAVWTTVLAALENRIDPNVVSLILGVLGIFVLGRAANQAVARFSERRPAARLDIEQAENVNVTPQDTDDDRPPARPKRSRLLG